MGRGEREAPSGLRVAHRLFTGVRGRWKLRSAAGETLAVSSQGYGDKHSCHEEIRSVMSEHPGADILDVAVD